MHQLKREMLTFSRDLEFFELQTLRAATGQSERNFHNVILKELLDNALDACEAASVSPDITVGVVYRPDMSNSASNGWFHFHICDNAGGLSRDTIERVLDIQSFTSDKSAYKAPLRGAQGNALKTIMGIPVALSGGRECVPLVIEAGGIAYSVRVKPDQVLQKVDVDIQEQHVDHDNTVIKTWIPQLYAPEGFRYGVDGEISVWYSVVEKYALFNPHARFTLKWRDDGFVSREVVFGPTSTEYKKFLPTDPTSPWWYTESDITKLIHGYISNGYDRTLREFLTEFRGLSRASATKSITDQFPNIKRLSDIQRSNGDLGLLLQSMRAQAAEPKPAILRSLGKEHFNRFLGDDGFQYKKIESTFDHEGARIPFTVEMASAKSEMGFREVLIGINHSVAYSDPFIAGTNWFEVTKSNKRWSGQSLSGLLNAFEVSSDDNFKLALHLICPNIQYTDKSKSKFSVDPFVDAVAEATYHVCKQHYAEKKAAERQQRSYERQIEQRKPKEEKVTIKDAVFAVMEDAVDQASGCGRLPYSARTLYYQVRPRIQEYTDEELDYNYFTPQLETEYQDIYGPLDGLYHEPAGKMIEPHTERIIPLGTLEVESYRIPEYRYNKILYVEKMGLAKVIQAVRIPERYDLAIMAGKGYATRASKALIDMTENISDIVVCVLHDADVDGVEIVRTLQEETRTASARKVEILDLGLGPSEAWDLSLQTETVIRKKAAPDSIYSSLSREEADWLVGNGFWAGNKKRWKAQRIELNAMPSDEFIQWLEDKLDSAGLTEKVIPPADRVKSASDSIIVGELARLVEDMVFGALLKQLGTSRRQLYGQLERQLHQYLSLFDYRSELVGLLADNPGRGWEDCNEDHVKRILSIVLNSDIVESKIQQIVGNLLAIQQAE